jgi:hypothetical protein
MLYKTRWGTHIDLSKIVAITAETTYKSVSVTAQLLNEPMKFHLQHAADNQYGEDCDKRAQALAAEGKDKNEAYANYAVGCDALRIEWVNDLMQAWTDYKASRAARLDALLTRLDGSSDKDAVALINALS